MEARHAWSMACPEEDPPKDPAPSEVQTQWDGPLCERTQKGLLESCGSETERTLLLAVSERESGFWLQAYPSVSIGTLIVVPTTHNNPNAVQFRAAYKKLLIRAEIRYKGFGNCVPLQQINILTCSGKNPSKPIKRLTEKQSFVEVPEDHSDFRLRPREKVGLLQIYAKC